MGELFARQADRIDRHSVAFGGGRGERSPAAADFEHCIALAQVKTIEDRANLGRLGRFELAGTLRQG